MNPENVHKKFSKRAAKANDCNGGEVNEQSLSRLADLSYIFKRIFNK